MKILLLFCGGTIIMNQNPDGSLKVKEKDDAIKSLLELEPRIHELADIDLEFITNIDSTNMKPEIWDKIAEAVYRNYENYDGFVITHGTDTMAYSSSALSFILQDIGKPVIFTGSQIPGDRINTDARKNLVNAITVATMDISGIYIVFDEKIILGSRASKVSASKLRAFKSINTKDIGEIRTDIVLNSVYNKRNNSKVKFMPGFEQNIFITTLFPGCNHDNIEFLLDNKNIKGLIFRALGPGNAPSGYEKLFEKAQKIKAPIVVSTQCIEGKTDIKLYELGKKLLDLGAIESNDMSFESTVTKFMWALKHYEYEKIKNIMHRNFVGEITETNSK